jgi:hypothetical protein
MRILLDIEWGISLPHYRVPAPSSVIWWGSVLLILLIFCVVLFNFALLLFVLRLVSNVISVSGDVCIGCCYFRDASCPLSWISTSTRRKPPPWSLFNLHSVQYISQFLLINYCKMHLHLILTSFIKKNKFHNLVRTI